MPLAAHVHTKEHQQGTAIKPMEVALPTRPEQKTNISSMISEFNTRRRSSQRVRDNSHSPQHFGGLSGSNKITKSQRQAWREAQMLTSTSSQSIAQRPPRQIEQDDMPLQKYVHLIDKESNVTALEYQNKLAGIFIT